MEVRFLLWVVFLVYRSGRMQPRFLQGRLCFCEVWRGVLFEADFRFRPGVWGWVGGAGRLVDVCRVARCFVARCFVARCFAARCFAARCFVARCFVARCFVWGVVSLSLRFALTAVVSHWSPQ